MIYLDNILIYLKTWKKHENHVKEVLWWFQKENLILKLEKCEFYKQEIEYLNHIITTEELKMNSEKIWTIMEFPTLMNTIEILAFQGLADYY